VINEKHQTTDLEGKILRVLVIMSQEGTNEVGWMRWIGEVEWRSFNEENRKFA
jgi:hypothetical protein